MCFLVILQSDALANEKKLRVEETQTLNTKLAGKCKAGKSSIIDNNVDVLTYSCIFLTHSHGDQRFSSNYQ